MLPDVTGTTILGEYTSSSGEIAIVLLADGIARVWRGRPLSTDEYEVWYGEKTGG